MRFSDTSAIIPLLVSESSTPSALAAAAHDPGMFVWWATPVECASAIARLDREGAVDEGIVGVAFARLKELAASWHEIDPTDALREAAVRFLRVHPLRAANGLQLAAAFAAAEGRPSSLELLTLVDRLAAAARTEGFLIVDLPPASPKV